MDDHLFLNPRKLRDAVREGDLSAREVVEESLSRIEKVEEDLNAYISVFHDRALEEADEIDRRRERGETPGPLAGVPVAVKDNICTKGTKTTAGSDILREFTSPYDATVIDRLRTADAVIVGKTNLDEFAMGSSGENSAFRPTRNPWDTDRVPGGSSSGSAAAVAAGTVPVALGSDTGGSIRQPASFCGISGIKPSYGRVSRYGLIAYASSLDQIGTFSHHMDGGRLVLRHVAGKDRRDPTTVSRPPEETFVKKMNQKDLSGLKLGIPGEFFPDALEEEVETHVRNALSRLEEAGATLINVSLPHTEYALSAYYLIAPSEASSNLARYDGVLYGSRIEDSGETDSIYAATRENGLGEEVKRRILLGTFALSAGYRDEFYRRAQKARRLITEDFEEVFQEVDAVIGPTSPVLPFSLGEKISDPLELYLCDALTVPCNLAGLAGGSIPCGFVKDRLPVGLQIITPQHGEETLFRVAETFQSETRFHNKRPAIFSGSSNGKPEEE